MEYDKIDASEGIDTNKIGSLHEGIVYCYWYFLKIRFKFQPKVCDGCYVMTQKSISFDDAVIVTWKRRNYRIKFWSMTKNEAVDKMKYADLNEKSGQL